jgi:hypothetical protein
LRPGSGLPLHTIFPLPLIKGISHDWDMFKSTSMIQHGWEVEMGEQEEQILNLLFKIKWRPLV